MATATQTPTTGSGVVFYRLTVQQFERARILVGVGRDPFRFGRVGLSGSTVPGTLH